MNKHKSLKLFITFFFSFITLSLSAQIDSSALISSQKVIELLNDINALQLKEIYANRYKLYPTENLYNLLKLDTQTGRIEQVQWSLDNKKEFTSIINGQDLSWGNGLNSFELCPTQNMYQFVLIDRATGRTWHVQWGLDDKKRWIRQIY